MNLKENYFKKIDQNNKFLILLELLLLIDDHEAFDKEMVHSVILKIPIQLNRFLFHQ